MNKITKQSMFDLIEGIPNIPEDAGKKLVTYYDQRTQQFIVIVLNGNVLLRYYWNGFDADFSDIQVDYAFL